MRHRQSDIWPAAAADTWAQLLQAMEGYVLAAGALVGTYQPR